MAFYSPSESTFTRHYREEVSMAFSAVDCALNGDLAVYASTELTSGKRLYDELERHRLSNAADLRQKIGAAGFEATIWTVNVKAAIEFAKTVRRTLGGETLVITPAPFTAPGWSQPEYLAFWETLIRTRIRSAWFNDNWQFSNGCTFEFAVAQDAGLATFDAYGNPLGLREGIVLIEDSVAWLARLGLDASKLQENLQRLRELPRAREVLSR
jgi:hypothetical protein